jgi:pimeloyl-ACP methyl ester carboxylesterase
MYTNPSTSLTQIDRAARPMPGRACAVPLVLVSFLLTGGCIGPWRSTPAPVPVLQLASSARPGCLFVLLPGRGDTLRTYQRSGFAELLAEHGVRADVVAVDLHLGYYARRIAHTRLHEDVIAPARARGVQHIWVAGVSIGGLGALVYDRSFPGELDGIVLLAPYLGDRPVIDEVTAAGGLADWRPPTPLAPDDSQREIWQHLQARLGPNAHPTPLLLGWGRRDAFAGANGLLAATLPKDAVFTEDGAHDWKTWKKLWSHMIDSGQLGADCR